MNPGTWRARVLGLGLAGMIVGGCFLLLASALLLPHDPWRLVIHCGNPTFRPSRDAEVLAVNNRPFDDWLAESWPPWSAKVSPEWQYGATITYTLKTFPERGRDIVEEAIVLSSPTAIFDPSTWLNRLSPRAPFLFLSISTLVVGLFAFWHRPHEKASRLFFFWCVAVLTRWFLDTPRYEFAFSQLVYAWPFWIRWLATLLSSEMMVALGVHFALVFPEEKTFLRKHRLPVLALLYGGALIAEFVPVLTIRPLSCALIRTEHVEDLLFILATMIGIAALFHGYRTATLPTTRAQLRWVFWGAAIAFLPGIVNTSIPSLFERPAGPIPYEWIVALISLFPLSIGVAIARYRLWDIDLLINRSLVYGPVVVLLTGIYFAGVTLAQSVIRQLTGQTSELAIVITTLAIAAAFTPIRDRVQQVVNRLFYRERVLWAPLLRDYAHRVQEALSLEKLIAEVSLVLEKALKPVRVCLWLYEDASGQLIRVAGTGPERVPLHKSAHDHLVEQSRPRRLIPRLRDEAGRTLQVMGAVVAVPMVSADRLIGLMALWPKKSGAEYSGEELDFLETLAGETALSLRNAQLSEELRRRVEDLRQAYSHVVAAREEERRDLAEELHDETLQQLAKLAFLVDQSRRDLQRDPVRLAQRLETLQLQVEATDQRLRGIVAGLHPAVLVDLGLVPALRAYLNSLLERQVSFEQPVELTLHVRGFGKERLPQPSQELAIYRFVQEALTNVFKHAGAGRVWIEVEWSGQVLIRVTDDGRGIGEMTVNQAVRAGHFGLLSMQERIQALGGTFELAPRLGGGTIVQGQLPLSQPSPNPRGEETVTIRLVPPAPPSAQ